MPTPTKVEISVAGTLNGTEFTAKGRLRVDPAVGVKQGSITFTPLPRGLAASPNGGGSIADSICVPVSRCFVGAKPVRPRNFLEPLRLLGEEFLSNRLTRIEGHGAIAQTERSRLSGGTLYSSQLLLGDFDLPEIRTKSFSTEVLEVSAPDTMMSTGECTLQTPTGRELQVQFSHVYRALAPDRGLFRAHHGGRYVLCFDSSSEVRGRVITYRTKSVIGTLESAAPTRRK